MMSWSGYFFLCPSSFLMEVVVLVHDYVMLFITSILLLVVYGGFSLLLINDFDSSFFEDHQLEMVWTIIPFIVLLLIILPSLNSLYMLDSCVFCGLPIFIMGRQWYWSYFMSSSDVSFDSFMVPKESSKIYVLEADNCLVLPFGVPIRCSLSSSDVIHSWTLPSLGVKMDAVPGRINNFCFSLKRPGTFFGQCSEICGANHSFMPINIESVSSNDFLGI